MSFSAFNLEKTKINMLPAMQELCQMENSCPVPVSPVKLQRASKSYGFASRIVIPSTQLQSFSPRSMAFDSLASQDYKSLVKKVGEILISRQVPDIYLKNLILPFNNKLAAWGQKGFNEKLDDENQQPLENLVHAILQNFGETEASRVQRKNTEALREVISDLYQKFLDSNCILGNVDACKPTPSPVPNWSREDLSTYSRPGSLADLGGNVSLVNVPERYALRSAISWGCLGHEVAGHDILGAYPDAFNELQNEIIESLKGENLNNIAPHWSRWLGEATSDVLSVLNMGPSAALSLIAFLRSLGRNQQFKLNASGYIRDVHPIDLIRGFLVAYAVQEIPSKTFSNAKEYAKLLLDDVEKDAAHIEECLLIVALGNKDNYQTFIEEFLDENNISRNAYKNSIRIVKDILTNHNWKDKYIDFLASKGLPETRKLADSNNRIASMKTVAYNFLLSDLKRSAEIVAKKIVSSKLKSLGKQSFSDIRCWNDNDEKICKVFRKLLKIEDQHDPVSSYKEGYFAAHVVSAAVMESVIEKKEGSITQEKLDRVFNRMTSILQNMNKTNPNWKVS